MLTSLFARNATRTTTCKTLHAKPVCEPERHFGMEGLEGRMLMSVSVPHVEALPHVPKGAAGAINQLVKTIRKTDVNLGQLVNVSIGKVTNLAVNQAGDLVATINAVVRTPGGNTTVPVTLTLDRPAAATGDVVAAATTDILNLHLGPIDLDLLGLRVQTSEICLDVTATTGPGNLLGNLLSEIGGLLDQTVTSDLLGRITGILNRILPLNLGVNLTNFASQGGNLVANGNLSLSALGRTVTSPFSALVGQDDAATPAAVCDILNLEVGPLDLNLLGLGVHLDDCDNGPVTVDVTAIPGPGNLLGNLLCGLVGLLDNGLPLNQVLNRLNRLLNRLDRLDRILDQLDRLDQILGRLDRLDRILDRLDRILDRL
jgi:hypothetical protein